MAHASLIKMSLNGGGSRVRTTRVNGREMMTADLVQDVDNNDVNEGLVINEEVSSSNQATASITAQMRPTAKQNGDMLSYNYPSSLTEVVLVGNNKESSANEKLTTMGQCCNSCGMQFIVIDG